MVRHMIIAMVALVLACPLWSQETGGTRISAGQSIHRDIGPLGIDIAVDELYARVTVTLKLGGALVGEQVLTPDSSGYDFAVINGPDTARGTIRMLLVAAPRLSAINAKVVAMHGKDPPLGFIGSLCSWLAPENQIWAEQTMALMGDLTAQTVVRGSNRTNVTVTLMSGSLVLYSLTVTQASPVAQIPDSLVLGDVIVAPGAKFTMTIPTAMQSGQMFMQAVFQSRTIPPTPFAADIAIWQ